MKKAFKLADIHVEGQTLPVEARVNPRARKLRLRFSRDYQSLILTLPHQRFAAKAQDFLEQSEGWVRQNLPDPDKLVRLCPGQTISYLGKKVQLLHKPHGRASVWATEDSLCIYGPEARFEDILVQHLKKEIRKILVERVQAHTEALNISYNKLYIRDSQSNWGCCSHKRNLSFSWRLIFTPLGVIDYLAAHEVAHLIEMNHSKKFWLIVKSLCPDLQTHRQWLNQNGKYLL